MIFYIWKKQYQKIFAFPIVEGGKRPIDFPNDIAEISEHLKYKVGADFVTDSPKPRFYWDVYISSSDEESGDCDSLEQAKTECEKYLLACGYQAVSEAQLNIL